MSEKSPERKEPEIKYYQFNDGRFRLVAAQYGSWANDKRIVFRVREDRGVKERAIEKGIKFYDRVFPATDQEVQQWLDVHPDHKIIDES